MQQKPTKKFIRIAVVALVILGGVAFAQTPFGKKVFTGKKTTLQSGLSKNQTLGDLIGVDQNKNGISDWEERLYGLDPSVISTNGVNNKDIVLEKRVEAKTAAQNSQTDALAQAVIATSSMLDGASIDSADAAVISAEILKKTLKTKNQINPYTIDDIRTAKTTNDVFLSYKKNVSTIINNTPIGDSMETIALAVADNSGFNIENIKKDSAIYQDLTQKLLALKVPTAFAQEHLYFVNSIKNIAGSLAVLQITDATDKVAVVGAVASYRSAIIVGHEALAQLQESLVQYTDVEN